MDCLVRVESYNFLIEVLIILNKKLSAIPALLLVQGIFFPVFFLLNQLFHLVTQCAVHIKLLYGKTFTAYQLDPNDYLFSFCFIIKDA